MSFLPSLCLLSSALASAAPAPAEAPAAQLPAQRTRQALAKVRSIEISNQSLDVAVNQLRQQTGVNFVIDQAATPPTMLLGPGVNPYSHIMVSGEHHGLPVRDAAARLLAPHHLVTVQVGETVYVTRADRVTELLFGQPVRIDFKNEPLDKALEHLGQQTGANLLLDPRMAKAAQAPVTAKLEDISLEAAVVLLADQADLGMARVGNVLYITQPARAEKLSKAIPPPAPTSPFTPFNPLGTPPVGLLGAAGGPVGLGIGGAGVVGFGGITGFGGGPAPLVPLAPAPAEKPAPKPKADSPKPAKPAAVDPTGAAPLENKPEPAPRKPEPANAPKRTSSKERRARRERRHAVIVE